MTMVMLWLLSGLLGWAVLSHQLHKTSQKMSWVGSPVSSILLRVAKKRFLFVLAGPVSLLGSAIFVLSIPLPFRHWGLRWQVPTTV